MRALPYIIIILAASLPILFRRRLWLRIASVAALWLFGVALIWGHGVALHRLVTIRGAEQFHPQPDGQLPVDFQTATRIVQDLSQSQLPFTMLVFVAFTILALVPFSPATKSISNETGRAQSAAAPNETVG
jgi:hypothetical protein